MNTIVKFQAECKCCGKLIESVPFVVKPGIVTWLKSLETGERHAKDEFIRHNWTCLSQCCGNPTIWICPECSNKKTV